MTLNNVGQAGRIRIESILVIFGGLPGSGKTTIARLLAEKIDAVYLRIDTIEQSLRTSGPVADYLRDAGYVAAYAMAGDNLRLGHIVVADSVNPLEITRQAWFSVAQCASVPAIEIEVICSDVSEHERRVETRETDVAGFKLPSWQDVVNQKYEAWNRPHLVVDSTRESASEIVTSIISHSSLIPEQGLAKTGVPPIKG